MQVIIKKVQNIIFTSLKELFLIKKERTVIQPRELQF